MDKIDELLNSTFKEYCELDHLDVKSFVLSMISTNNTTNIQPYFLLFKTLLYQ